MNLKNIKANFLGDSITEGVGVSSSDKIYHQLVAKKYGFAEARNYGISGTRFARQINPTLDNPSFDRDFCSRFSQMSDDADLLVVFGGTNDFGHGDALMGKMEDRSPDTFFGACHYLMSGLIEKYPNSKIVIMTPLHRASEDIKKYNGFYLKDYISAIKTVANHYSLPILDLWSVCEIKPNDPEIKQKYCPDGLHPNDAGHEIIAKAVGEFLESL